MPYNEASNQYEMKSNYTKVFITIKDQNFMYIFGTGVLQTEIRQSSRLALYGKKTND